MADMRLIVITQYAENYGNRWKYKGGSEYVVAKYTYSQLCKLTAQDHARTVASFRDKIEYRNEMSEESIIDWVLIDHNELTEDERDQMEFEGKIINPAKDLTQETCDV